MKYIDDIFFVDKEGKRIYSEDVASHGALAEIILQKNEELRKEFEQSKRSNPVDFLIYQKGYLKISNQGYYHKIVFTSLNISDKQRRIIMGFKQEGYEVDDLAIHQFKDKYR